MPDVTRLIAKECRNCGKSFEILPCHSSRIYCSKGCATKLRWKNGGLKVHSQSEESNQKRSQKLKGIIRSKEFGYSISKAKKGIKQQDWVRKQTSGNMIKKWKDPKYAERQIDCIMLGKSKRPYKTAFYREDLGCYFRSRWEANFARILNYIGVKWEYEPKKFRLSDGTYYTPDFHILPNGVWFEIKGYSKDKKWNRKFYKIIFEENLSIFAVGKPQYEELQKEYGLIPGWER